MARFSPLKFGVALPITLLSHAALADVTPTEVWGDWRSYMEGVGYSVEATETVNGDNLMISDIILNFPMPDEAGQMEMTLGAIAFNQNGDGSVAIVLPETIPISVAGKTKPDDEEFKMTMNYVQTGHSLIASGSPAAMTYLYKAETVAMDMAQMQVGDDSLGQDLMRFNFAGTDINTTTTMTKGDTRGYEQSGSIEKMTYDIFFKNPEDADTQGAIKGTINGVTMNGVGTMPLTIAAGADVSTLLAAGFNVTGKINIASGSSEFDIKDPENGSYTMASSSQGGEFGVAMGTDGLAYNIAQRDVKMNITAAAMPFPIEITMAENGFNLAMPISKSDEPQDFAFGMKMAGFTMSDMIWGMFDPAGQLPRDPATVIVDLSGKAKLLVDWMNPEAVENLESTPGELKQVSLNNLVLDAVGAKLEGSGDFVISNEGPALVPDLGTPVGELNFALAGGNGLLDKLVAMGFLPQEQAMGARMMMGMFTVAGEAPDTLTSKIEVTPEGQVMANGQRLR